jgi:hypothetical protein
VNDANEQGRERRALGSRRLALAAIGLTLVVVVVVLVVNPFGGPGKPSGVSDNATPTSLATVTRRELSSQTQVSATLGFAGSSSIRVPAGTPPSAVQQAEQAVGNGEEMLQAARASLAADGETLAGAQATVSAAREKQALDCAGDGAAESASAGGAPSSEGTPAGSASGDGGSSSGDGGSSSGDGGSSSGDGGSGVCASDAQSVASDAQGSSAQELKLAGDRASISSAEKALASAEAALSAARASEVSYGQSSTFTMLPAVGQVVSRGQTLYAISGRPVVLLYGSPATRALPLGSVVFEPGPVRVTSVTPTLGASVVPGPVLGITSTTPQVTIALPASEQASIKVGDPVTITLPSRETTPGVVSSVGSVAKAPSSKGGEGGGGPEGGEEGGATIEVNVALRDPRASGHLDEAPVSVTITTGSVPGALAVPVDALLALAGGGYALELVEGRVHRLEAVTLGLFDDAEGLVQVSGREVAAGQRVVVPAT